VKLKDFNIVYGALLVSLLIAEICFEVLFNFYVIRFLQLFIIINLLDLRVNFLKNLILFAVPALLYLLYSFFSLDQYIVLADLFNLFWWFGFMTILNRFITDEPDFEKFKKILFHSSFFFATIAAFVGIFKLYFLGLYEVPQPDGTIIILIGTALNLDYNVFSIGLFCGLFGGLYCYKHAVNYKFKILYAIAILSILACAMMSGSRRALVIGLILVPYLIFWSYRLRPTYIHQHNEFIKINRWVTFPWIPFFIFLVLIYFVSQFGVSTFFESNDELNYVFNRLLTISDILTKDDDSRSGRWAFSFNYFSDLPIYAKLFGGGFSYLQQFGNYFGESELDYPHNVWISALLYGGILGFITTVILTFYVLFFLLKRKDLFGELIVWYLLFLFFYFTSANSIFSSRIFNILILLPFLSICHPRKNITQEA